MRICIFYETVDLIKAKKLRNRLNKMPWAKPNSLGVVVVSNRKLLEARKIIAMYGLKILDECPVVTLFTR